MGYKKYVWVGNRISEESMAKLYRCKQKTLRPITRLVAEAVDLYLANCKKCSACNDVVNSEII